MRSAPSLLSALRNAAAVSSLAVPLAAHATPVAGVWSGDIDTPAGPIGMVFHLTHLPNGTWIGSIDTPAQGLFGLPATGVTVEGVSVEVDCGLTQAVWRAAQRDDGQTLAGTWSQRGAELPLTCTRVATPPPVPPQLARELVGTWEGALDVGAVRLRLILELRQLGPETLGGFMVSPDQSPDEVAIGRVAWTTGRSIRVLVGSILGAFDVTLAANGEMLSGRFIQGGTPLDIALARVESPTTVNRPQTPTPPFPYVSEDVSYMNTEAGVTLAGTLTRPDGTGPFPAAILITGSGPQNRNEEIFQHKPFWVIADALTRRGIAVLRVDDRGVGGSSAGPHPERDTSFDFAGDVEAGVAFLKARPEIASDSIGLIGHSEGGMIAPIVAARNGDVAFIVLMAGTGVRGDALLLSQTEAIMRADGEDDVACEAASKTNALLFKVLLDEDLSSEEADAAMRSIITADPAFAAASEDEQVAGMESALQQLNNPWMRAFIRHDPSIPLRRVTCPVLAINGTLDLQVPCEANLESIQAALAQGGNTDVTIVPIPGLNHLFQHSETGRVSEYGDIEETISVEVLDLLADWIDDRFPSPPTAARP